jgi:predicted NAD/FAD-binding protein
MILFAQANNNVKIARDETAKLSEQCRSIENERRLAVESHEKAIQAYVLLAFVSLVSLIFDMIRSCSLTVSHESSIAQLLTQHQQALVALQSKHEVDVAEAVQAALQLEHSKFQVEAQNAEKKLRDEFSQQSSAMQEQVSAKAHCISLVHLP